MEKEKIKLGDILGGKQKEGEVQEVEMRPPSLKGRTLISRSASPAKRVKRMASDSGEAGSGAGASVSASDSVIRSADECEIDRMRAITGRLKKFVFNESNRVSKQQIEFFSGCAAEYEDAMVRMMQKNERLTGRLMEREKYMELRVSECVQRVQEARPVSYAGMAGKMSSANVRMSGGSTQSTTERMSERPHTKTYAVVVKAKDESVKLTSEQVKEKVLKNVSSELNIRVRAVRKTRSGGLAIEAASEKEVRQLSECKKFA